MTDLNPLDILKSRELSTMPPHFSKVKVGSYDRVDPNLQNWINGKLTGRYSIFSYPTLDSEGKLSNSTYVGFENEKELTYFMLACPYLRRN